MNEAKNAVKGFVESYFLEQPSNLERASYFLQQMHIHAIAKPMLSGRKVNNQYIDYQSPSFWHACCAVLFRWMYERMLSNSNNRNIMVYRGQTNPWPIMPSLRRGTLPDNGIDYTREMTKVLEHFLIAKEENPINFFEVLDKNNGLNLLAQHHHFPTNFLDFTFHPMVALYFASMESDKGLTGNKNLDGNGVIFESTFNNFLALTENTKIKLDLTLLPPLYVPRIYQQQGFLLDCKEATNYHIAEIEQASERIFFPRDYPKIKGIEEVFSEDLMIKYLSNNYNEWNSEVAIWTETEWYGAHEGYKNIISILLNYIKTTKEQFQVEEVITLIKKENIEIKLPPKMNSKLQYQMDSQFQRASNLAEELSKAIKFLKDISFTRDSDKLKMHELILINYAKANPGLFKAIKELSSKFSILEFEHMPSELVMNPKIDSIVKDSLSDNQLSELNKLLPLRFGN